MTAPDWVLAVVSWTCGDLGDDQREVTFEPLPEHTQPAPEPAPEPAPAPVPDREGVPA